MDGRAAFASPEFRAWQVGRVASVIAQQMQYVALGYSIYDLTGKTLDLGLLGLVQFVPVAGLSLVSGSVADRFDRRRVALICQSAQVACSLLLLAAAIALPRSVWPIYVVAFLLGVARSFFGPAGQALVPSLVPPEHFANAIAWSSSLWQLATIIGPALGGIVMGVFGGSAGVYGVASVLSLVSAASISLIGPRPPKAPRGAASLDTVLAGLRFVFSNKVVLGSITVDLFAVLLGGATALLPPVARDILHVGPLGLGLLRSAPAAGAAIVAIAVAYRPIRTRAGTKMLASVALFGLGTVVFGLSTSFPLSLAALAVLGGADMISVVVRSVVIQRATPDEMRGRVSAVNTVFIVASNELGEMESGLAAAWLGTVPAIVAGGIGTMLVVIACAVAFPGLRKAEME
jgi:MFS family permease